MKQKFPKIIFAVVIAFIVIINVTAQSSKRLNRLEYKARELESEAARLKSRTNRIENELNSKLTKAEKELESLRGEGTKLRSQLESTTTSLNAEIEKNRANTDQGDKGLAEALGRNTNFWISAFGFTLILTGSVFTFLFVSGRNSRKLLVTELEETRLTLGEQAVKADSKILELLEKQMKISGPGIQAGSAPVEVDHGLVLKVADEITRIENNLNQMDQNVRGHKQLSSCVIRIKDNLLANRYEIVSMLNKPYDAGMFVDAEFVPNDDLETGQEIITRVVKPQVNFDGKLIQGAKVVVAIGG